MENYSISYNKLINKIKAVRNIENISMLATGLFMAAFVTLSIFYLSILLESVALGDVTFRTILFGIVATISATALIYFLLPGFLRVTGIRNNPTYEQLALRIGNFYPNLKDKLCNAMQIVPINPKKSFYSDDLAIAAFDKVYSESAELDFKIITQEQNKKLRKSLFLFFSIAILTFGSLGIFQNTLGESMHRLMNFTVSFVPPPPFTISLEPKETELFRGDSLIIVVSGTGSLPETIYIHFKENLQENYDRFQIRLNDETNSYTYIVPSLKNSVSYYASADWMNSSITTDVGNAKVIDKPILRTITGRIVFPSYTNLNPRQFDEQTADISALKGSLIEIRTVSNKELDSAFIVISREPDIDILKASLSDANEQDFEPNTRQIAMNTESNSANGSFRVNHSGTYYIKIIDKDGQTNSDPIIYTIRALDDEYPTITLIEPEGDAQLNRDALLPIRTIISDDYGFTYLRLYYKLTQSRFTYPDEDFSYIDINIAKNEIYSETAYVWDLNKLSITPEDTYEFYLEVADNDIVSGPKLAKTRIMKLRLPSMNEILERTNQSQKKLQEELAEAFKEAEDIKKDMEKLNRELLQKKQSKELDWDTKKKAEDIIKRQEKLSEKFEELSENVQDMTQQLQENNMLSPETLQKFMELQQLMQQVNSPELRRMQERMQEAMQNLSPEELRKAMEQYEFNEEQFRKSIERTMKILQRLQAEQKVDALQKRAEEMLKQLDDLQKQMDNTNPSDKDKISDLNKRQEQIKDDLQNMQNEMSALEDLMKEIGENEMPMALLTEAEDALNAEESKQQMQDAAKDAQQGNMSQSKQKMSKAQQNVSQFAQKMQDMKQQMQQDNNQEAIRNMQKAINDMLELSKRQENLKNKTQNTDNNTTQIPDFAKDQASIMESMMNVANAMMELSQKSFAVTPEMGMEIGQSIQSMQQSVGQMADRRMSTAARSQGQAMSSMNRAITQMQDMLQNMQGEGSCDNGSGMSQGKGNPGGMMSFSQRMQQLAAQQQAMNQSLQQQMQGMQQGQGGQLTQEQQAELGRIAGEQGDAKKSLEELAKEQKEMGGAERKTLGDLDKIAKEMQEVVKEIQSGNITPETMKRQERILSRLLDANRSIHDRDFEQRRKGKTAEQLFGEDPGNINMNSEEARKRALEELLKSNRLGFSKDYEMLIRKYFENLQDVEQ